MWDYFVPLFPVVYLIVKAARYRGRYKKWVAWSVSFALILFLYLNSHLVHDRLSRLARGGGSPSGIQDTDENEGF